MKKILNFLFVCVFVFSSAAQAAKISNLPDGNVVGGDSELPFNDGGTTRKGTLSDQVWNDITAKNGKTSGAICDGLSHPASDYYASLAALQADYSTATSTSEEMDSIVVEYYASTNQAMYIPAGTCLMDQEISLASKTIHIKSNAAGILKGYGSEKDTFLTCSDCDVYLEGVNLDGENVFQTGFSLSAPVPFEVVDFEGYDLGWSSTEATQLVTPLSLSGDLGKFNIDGFKVSDLNAVGDGTYGNSSGGARALVILPASSSDNIDGTIENFYFDANGSDAEELDVFNLNVNSIYPSQVTFINPVILYNGNTRRCIKVHSGDVTLVAPKIFKSTDFATATSTDTSTDVGAKNLTCVDMAGSQQGSITIQGGYLDVSGFPTGFGSTAGCTDCYVRAFDTEFIGATLAIDRTHNENGVVGTAQAGGASTITLAADSSASDDFYNGDTIRIISGTNDADTTSRTITDYDGTTKIATVSAAWSVTPDNTSVYSLNHQTGSPISFVTGTGDNGSGCFNCYFKEGYVGAQLRGDHSFLKGCYFDDPVYHPFWINATNKEGLVLKDNVVVTKTTDRLFDGFRVAPVQGTNATVEITGNTLRQDGNTEHRCDFIDILTASITGVVAFNSAPATCYSSGTMRTVDNDSGSLVHIVNNDFNTSKIIDDDITLDDVEADLNAPGYFIMDHAPASDSASVKAALYGQMELSNEFGAAGAGHSIAVLGRNENNGIGSDLVTNGGFADNTNWTEGSDWLISSGVATVTSAAAPTLLEQPITLVDSATYRMTYTISGYSAGSITPIGGGTSMTTRAANGTYTEDVVVSTTDSIQFYADTGTTASIDNVTFKRVRQEVFGIGVEGRLDPEVGNFTTGAAFTATFGTDTDMDGNITYGIGYYMPNQSDAGHITYKYSWFSDDANFTMRQDGATEFNSGVTPVVTTVGSLGTPATGTIKTISDGTGATDCTTGGGSTFNVCVYNGSAWQDLN